MVGVPIAFRKSTENIIASYDSTAIATGKGIATFYLANVSGGTTHVLSDKTFWSQTGRRTFNGATEANMTFDIEFGKTINMEGEAILNVPLEYTHVGGSSDDIEETIKATLYKVRGGSAVVLASAGVFLENDVVTTEATRAMLTLAFDVPKTAFSKSDKLRVNISGSPVTTNATPSNMGRHYYLDPLNRSLTTLSTGTPQTNSRATLLMPIKIDL